MSRAKEFIAVLFGKRSHREREVEEARKHTDALREEVRRQAPKITTEDAIRGIVGERANGH